MWDATTKLALPAVALAFVVGIFCGSGFEHFRSIGQQSTASDTAAAAHVSSRALPEARLVAGGEERPHSHSHPKSLLPAVPVPRWHAYRRDVPIPDNPEPVPAGGGASSQSEGSSPAAFIWLDKTTLDGHEATVTIRWSNVSFGTINDWIGMWAEDDSFTRDNMFGTPIKFQFISGDWRYCYNKHEKYCNADTLCTWQKYKCVPAPPPTEGSMQFQVWNKRQHVVFRYISGNMQYPELIAESQTLKVENKGIPQGAHLAFASDPTKMRIFWQAGEHAGKTGVKYGRSCGNLTEFAEGKADPVRQFKKADMCDTAVAPAGRQGWFDPGTLYEATFIGLEPGQTYCYTYGDDKHGWEEPREFTAAPVSGPRYPTTVAAFGDMGQVETDGSRHHSWDFENKGEIPSANTTEAVAADKDADFVLHIGDISYAVGYMSEWDNFFRQITGVASRKPWMTAIGNHEMVFSNSYYAGSDSGGECGVPYNAYFPFASQDDGSDTKLFYRRPWYSFEHGPATFVVMSTEHNMTRGSGQHDWIEKTLAAVDRKKTPWVIFTGHRPMYSVAGYPEDDHVAAEMQEHVEPLLLKYNVDLALWGHFHAWVHFQKLARGKADTAGIQHLIIGMAGYDLSHPQQSDLVVSSNDKDWGYLRMTFQSDSEARMEFVSGATRQPLESFAIQGNARRLEGAAAAMDLTV